MVLVLLRGAVAGSVSAHSETFPLAWRVSIFLSLWLKYKQIHCIISERINLGELLPPANEVCEGYVFMPDCQSFC